MLFTSSRSRLCAKRSSAVISRIEVSPPPRRRFTSAVAAGITPSGMNSTTSPSSIPVATRWNWESPKLSLKYSSAKPTTSAPSSGPKRLRTPPSSDISTM